LVCHPQSLRFVLGDAFSGDRLICLLVAGGTLPKRGRVENGSLLSYVVLVDGTQR